MAIGPISSPATWNVGIVFSPAWGQSVQDNINGLIAGSGPTLGGLLVDGSGAGSSPSNQQAHAIVSGTAPSISVGAGAGTGGSVSIVLGNDTCGIIGVSMGTSPPANSQIFRVTFAKSYPKPVVVILMPNQANTAALSGSSAPYLSTNLVGTTTVWDLFSNSTPLAASVSHQWAYFVIGTGF